MLKLKKIYKKISKQTQNKLQEIFDTFKFTSENLYNIADNKTKNRMNTYIETWKEQGLLKGYFGILAKNIYNRTRVKNSEILELLIYSAYIEEQDKLDKYEQQIMYEDANYYYQQGQQEVNKTLKKKKLISMLDMALFLYLIEQPNYSGFNWKQYVDATIQYNTQQIYKQVILNIQQQKELKIESNEFQRLIQQQNNQKLNINGNKIFGAMDMQMIGLNNNSKIEGIIEIVRKKIGKTLDQIKEIINKPNNEFDIKVRFIAVEDNSTTPMCSSLNNQIFSVSKMNKFKRYYGNTAKELKIKKFKVKGLVLGINMPPIIRTFSLLQKYISLSNR